MILVNIFLCRVWEKIYTINLDTLIYFFKEYFYESKMFSY